jgi:predicted nucleotidyltransferase
MMPGMINNLLGQYVEVVREIYGDRLKSVILYGSYARGDFRPDSDIDIMILADLTEMEIEEFGRQLSWSTYDFNEEHETDIKPIAKSAAHFKKWQGVYPFYTNVQQEGVELYGTA